MKNPLALVKNERENLGSIMVPDGDTLLGICLIVIQIMF